MFKKLVYFSVLFSLFSCRETSIDSEDSVEPFVSDVVEAPSQLNAFTLIQNTCTSCHSLDINGNATAAPTFAAIKEN